MKILAVDYGDSRTGLATCDRTEFLTTAITPQITLKARNKVAARVCEVAKEIEAEMILIGLPLNMDGTEGERAAKSRKLAKTVELWSGLPVRMWAGVIAKQKQKRTMAATLLRAFKVIWGAARRYWIRSAPRSFWRTTLHGARSIRGRCKKERCLCLRTGIVLFCFCFAITPDRSRCSRC